MISTRDLAKLAGVSQTTISRCLNNHQHISSETRDKILKIAKENGFLFKSKEMIAKNIKNKNFIAIIYNNFAYKSETDYYIDMLINSLMKVIETYDYFPILSSNLIHNSQTKRLETLVKNPMLLGCIIINPDYQSRITRYLEFVDIPFIHLHYFNKDSLENINIVDTNHYAGGYLATQHLIEFGHKNIISLTSIGREYEGRTEGYSIAMEDAKLEKYKSVHVLDGTFDSGYNFVLEHGDLLAQTTAIFSQSDLMSLGCIKGAIKKGIHIPQDLSIVSYDGIEIGRFGVPELTTVIQPTKELALTTVERLFEIVQTGEANTFKTIIQPTLLVRESTDYLKEN